MAKQLTLPISVALLRCQLAWVLAAAHSAAFERLHGPAQRAGRSSHLWLGCRGAGAGVQVCHSVDSRAPADGLDSDFLSRVDLHVTAPVPLLDPSPWSALLRLTAATSLSRYGPSETSLKMECSETRRRGGHGAEPAAGASCSSAARALALLCSASIVVVVIVSRASR